MTWLWRCPGPFSGPLGVFPLAGVFCSSCLRELICGWRPGCCFPFRFFVPRYMQCFLIHEIYNNPTMVVCLSVWVIALCSPDLYRDPMSLMTCCLACLRLALQSGALYPLIFCLLTESRGLYDIFWYYHILQYIRCWTVRSGRWPLWGNRRFGYAPAKETYFEDFDRFWARRHVP